MVTCTAAQPAFGRLQLGITQLINRGARRAAGDPVHGLIVDRLTQPLTVCIDDGTQQLGSGGLRQDLRGHQDPTFLGVYDFE